MSDNYKGARTVTTAGLTLSAGNVFSGFLSSTGTTSVTVSGTRTYNLAGDSASVTMGVSMGIVVPLKGNHIKPVGGNAIIFFD